MAELTTKQKIASVALDLFSQHGYEAVSVRDIARAVGIKESSLYNHYKNKQDIFDCIVVECSKTAGAFFDSIQLTEAFEGTGMDKFTHITDEEFLSLSMSIFQFYFEDETLVKFRKMLTIEQFRNEDIALIYREMFIEGVLRYQTQVFEMLIACDILINCDPEVLALQFYSPIFLLFSRYDELTEEAMDLMLAHIIQFKKIYSKFTI